MDIEIVDHGSIIEFLPQSLDGWHWIEDNLEVESWQWQKTYSAYGVEMKSFMVDHRMAESLADFAEEDGVEVYWEA